MILIILSLILLSSPLFGQSDADDKEIRYQNNFKVYCGKALVKEKYNQKIWVYVGSYKSGVHSMVKEQ